MAVKLRTLRCGQVCHVLVLTLTVLGECSSLVHRGVSKDEPQWRNEMQVPVILFWKTLLPSR